MENVFDQIGGLLRQSGLQGNALKDLLDRLVIQHWPSLPSWSTLKHPIIEEAQKVTVGSGVVITFNDGGVQKVLLGQAGAHYKNLTAPAYTIPGGFINLTRTPGSALVPPSGKLENPRTGAAREVEEEFKQEDGSPLLAIDPARLKPMDTDTILFPSGERRLVLGLMLELAADEVTHVKAHVMKLESDPEYKAAVAAQTANPESGKPEICDLKIFNLADVAAGRHELLHKDQQTLFRAVDDYFEIKNKPVPVRTTPTRSFLQKVETLDELQKTVEDLRTGGNPVIGITSGVFNILHPGHISFLEDASRQCDHLIVIIASDRTVKEQKGEEKPYISELKRAQSAAALSMVDSVIISDEFYHETVLKALKPEIMFKGDDYAGKKIIGADLADRVVLIPCAEKDFYSSSEFVRKIKAGEPDHSPAWGPG